MKSVVIHCICAYRAGQWTINDSVKGTVDLNFVNLPHFSHAGHVLTCNETKICICFSSCTHTLGLVGIYIFSLHTY